MRVLMTEPFEVVTSVEVNAQLPQVELCVRLPLLRFAEGGLVTDDGTEILDELFSLLSMFTLGRFRSTGLITYYGSPDERDQTGRGRTDRAMRALVTRLPYALPLETARPSATAPAAEPGLFSFDDRVFTMWLRKLARAPTFGEPFIAAAKLFASAIEVMRVRPEVAYVLLVSSIETMASVTLRGWEPSMEVKRQTCGPMLKEAAKLGISERSTRKLLLASLKSNGWLSKKFVEYMLRGTAGAPVPHPRHAADMPPPEDYGTVFASIYGARSKSVHAGRGMPATIEAMMDGRASVRAVREGMARALSGRWKSGDPPSVAWFANVVRVAHERTAMEKLHLRSAPVVAVSG